MGRTGHTRSGALLILILLAVVPWTVARADSGPDSETCLECHDGLDATLHGGAHQIGLGWGHSDRTMECSSCHSGGAEHIDDPSIDNIGVPSRMAPGDVSRLCGSCHQPHKGDGRLAFDPHIGLGLACTDCHTVHNNGERLETVDNSAFCGRCHVAAVQDFKKTSSHPLLDSELNCLSCHDFSGDADMSFGHGGNAKCYACHSEQSGPFMFEHEATSSFSPEGGDCTSCHSPHGSANDRLLTEPDDRLCRQCHGLPPLHRTQHEGLAMNFACMDCHTDVHGSHTNRNLLDNQLGSRIGGEPGSCFCHNVFD